MTDHDPLLFALAPPALIGTTSRGIRELHGLERRQAMSIVKIHHYAHELPSGKSHWLGYESAIVVWSIPANCNLGEFLLGGPGNVWELSRLWAPDGHRRNLLTQALSAAVAWIRRAENPDVLVSYADPNASHHGGIYRAASWIYQGQTDENRNYQAPDGQRMARRAFHSGRVGMSKAEIEADGYQELRLPGKHRYVKPISEKAKRILMPTATR